jgi:hypothetical protein
MMSDPIDDDGSGSPRTARVCRLLRTKTAFGTIDGGHDWQAGTSSTAAYWCLSTMQSAGPDDALAHPHGCLEGRACFQPPKE